MGTKNLLLPPPGVSYIRICVLSPYPDPTDKTADHPWVRSQDRGRPQVVLISLPASYDCYEGGNGVTLQLTLLPQYTTVHGEVKLPSPGLDRDDGQRLRAVCCAACRALPRCAMLTTVAL